MKIDILTLFPEMFVPLRASMLGKAAERGLLTIDVTDIREYTLDKHKKTDETPYGGGPGMIMTCDPVFRALRAVGASGRKTVYMSPRGRILDEETIRTILSRLLDMFPIREISVETAGWLPALRSGHWLKTAVFDAVRQAAQGLSVMQDVRALPEQLRECEYIQECAVRQIELGTGNVILRLALDPALFYRVLGEETGIEIHGENELFPVLLELAQIRREYERVRPALEEAEATGYGIIMPEAEELTLEEPEMIRQGGRYGVRLRASAPSLHIMKAGIQTTVSPIVGSEKQSEELVLYLLREFEENPAQIWDSNIFGKSLHELVNEGLRNKLFRMPADARPKLR